MAPTKVRQGYSFESKSTRDTLEDTESSERSIPKLRFSSPDYFWRSTSSQSSEPDFLSADSVRLEQVEKHYKIGSLIGEGGYGRVFSVQSKKNGQLFALKTITVPEKKDLANVEAEVTNASEFEHPYVLKMHAFFQEGRTYHLVFDLCTGGNLSQCVEEYVRVVKQYMPRWDAGLPTKLAAKYASQMLDGLQYLHHHGFVHRDIKPDNYLKLNYSEDSPLKMADFGMCVRIAPEEKLATALGTKGFIAPEVLKHCYDQKADVFSLGITIFSICANAIPADSCDAVAFFKSVKQFDRTKGQVLGPQLHSMVRSMLVFEPKYRPSVKQLLSDNEWLKHIGEENSNQGCCVVS